MAARRWRAFVLSLSVLCLGCSAEGDPRAQLLIVIDTDAPVTGQLAQDAAISAAAAVDTLRVDILEPASTPPLISFAVSQPDDWPLSFGLVSPPSGSTARIRLRLFKAELARRVIVNDEPVLEPSRGAPIDRLVDLQLPSEGVERYLVRLSFDCIGAASTFGSEAKTCVDGDRLLVAPDQGVESLGDDAPPASAVGTTAWARQLPCVGGPEQTQCIPGGFSFLGDVDFHGLGATSDDARPLRPIFSAPFAMDTTEFTVGRYRKLREQQATLPEPTPNEAFCTWQGQADGSADELPLNCVSYELAEAACQVAGGRTPSEAQWEHAARGRGLGWDFSWGDAVPRCCGASYGRFTDENGTFICGSDEGPERPGSHLSSDGCGLADISVDGVVDLAGSLSEAVRDRLQDYDEPCWMSRGVLQDWVCEAEVAARVSRGGNWAVGGNFLFSAARRRLTSSSAVGFRCVYEVAQ